MKETTKVPPSQDYALDSTAEQDSEKGETGMERMLTTRQPR